MGSQQTKLLSIIVCAYNEEKVISDKIKDLFTNDRDEQIHEVIIADDISSDETLQIAQGYADYYPKLRVIQNKNKKGKWGALVTGFESATGDIICITDADVTFLPDTIKNALSMFDNPKVGGVTSSQKTEPINNAPKLFTDVNIYEVIRNFFRKLESRIDSTTAFHGQCMFFRKSCLQLNVNMSMADDLHIAMTIRRNGYKTLFCKNSYYVEKMPVTFDGVTRSIFHRRAKAVVQTIIKNMDLLYSTGNMKFGLICFPIEIFINIISPFIIATILISTTAVLLFSPNTPSLLILGHILFIMAIRQLLIMVWYQMTSVVTYLLHPKRICIRWTTSRYGDTSPVCYANEINGEKPAPKKEEKVLESAKE